MVNATMLLSGLAFSVLGFFLLGPLQEIIQTSGTPSSLIATAFPFFPIAIGLGLIGFSFKGEQIA